MKRIFLASVFSFGCLLSGLATAGEVSVGQAWTRATAPGQKVAGVYLDIVSAADAKLVGVESPVGAAELHYMKMENGTMKMRAVESIDLPAGKTVSLKPGGYHVMLFDLKHPLSPGEQITLKLTIDDGKGQKTTLEVVADVRNLDGSEARQHHHHHE